MSDARPPIHIILIHGTWARGADWMQEDAPLHRGLREALGADAASASISPFNWSGRNSFRARTDATAKLRAAIHAVVARDAATRVYIVAHSHGGNIALQAAVDHEIAACIDGIVCLATPVIHSTLIATTKDDGGRAIRLWSMLAALVPIGLFADHVALEGAAQWTQIHPTLLLALLVFGIALIAAFARYVVPRLRRDDRIGRHNQRAAVKLNALLQPPQLDSARVVFVRHAGDEATLTANFLGLLGLLSDRASIILAQRYRRLDALLGSQTGRRLMVGAGVACVALIGLLQFVRSPELRGVAYALLFFALAVPPLTSLVLRLARAFGSLPTFFFGVAVVPIGSFIRMSIEPTPPGEWTVVMLPEPVGVVGGEDAQVDVPIVDAHSRVYQQPEFLAFVSAWIAGRVSGIGPSS